MWRSQIYAETERNGNKLFNSHSRSATVYVAEGQIYAEAESNANEFIRIYLSEKMTGMMTLKFTFRPYWTAGSHKGDMPTTLTASASRSGSTD